jgi:hypothetical protein
MTLGVPRDLQAMAAQNSNAIVESFLLSSEFSMSTSLNVEVIGGHSIRAHAEKQGMKKERTSV